MVGACVEFVMHTEFLHKQAAILLLRGLPRLTALPFRADGHEPGEPRAVLLLPEPTSWLRPQAIEVVDHFQVGMEYRREDTPHAMLCAEVRARLSA